MLSHTGRLATPAVRTGDAVASLCRSPPISWRGSTRAAHSWSSRPNREQRTNDAKLCQFAHELSLSIFWNSTVASDSSRAHQPSLLPVSISSWAARRAFGIDPRHAQLFEGARGDEIDLVRNLARLALLCSIDIIGDGLQVDIRITQAGK